MKPDWFVSGGGGEEGFFAVVTSLGVKVLMSIASKARKVPAHQQALSYQPFHARSSVQLFLRLDQIDMF
jgi:hypothetical protein